MPLCPFCHPANEHILHRGQRILGLWDAFPVAPGHALLVTRRHVADWFSASPDEQRELTDAVTLARDAILARGLLPNGFNIGLNAGEAAGQTVPHLHLHVYPPHPGRRVRPARGRAACAAREGQLPRALSGRHWGE